MTHRITVIVTVAAVACACFIAGYNLGDEEIECGSLHPPTWFEKHFLWPTIH